MLIVVFCKTEIQCKYQMCKNVNFLLTVIKFDIQIPVNVLV